jgi:hypothetical protein
MTDLASLSRDDLLGLSKTELVTIGKEVLGTYLRRDLDDVHMIDLIVGDDDLYDEDECPTMALRRQLETFFGRLENIRFAKQVICNTHCTTWGCPPLTAVAHYFDLKARLI